jgi:hypothetical protein
LTRAELKIRVSREVVQLHLGEGSAWCACAFHPV